MPTTPRGVQRTDLLQSAAHAYTELPCPGFSPHFLLRRPDKQIKQTGGLTAAGGRGWGAWVRPGGKGVK